MNKNEISKSNFNGKNSNNDCVYSEYAFCSKEMLSIIASSMFLV